MTSRRESKRQSKQLADEQYENPFTMPDPDQIFELREKEQIQKRKRREELAKLPIWEKNTHSSTVSTHKFNFRLEDEEEDENKGETEEERQARIKKEAAEAAAETLFTQKQGKEDLNTFVSRKKEMFFLHLNYNIKRREIQKLETAIKKREDMLKKEEEIYNENKKRFEKTVQQADKQAVLAIKKADQQIRKRAEKIAELKKLNITLAAIESEKSRYLEQLSENRRIKDFLDSLIPQDFKKQQYTKLAEIYDLANVSDVTQEMFDNSAEQYWVNSERLLNIFSDLEEKNLSLIQTKQEREEQFEVLKKQYEESLLELQKKQNSLDSQVNELQELIHKEEIEQSSGSVETMKIVGNFDYSKIEQQIANLYSMIQDQNNRNEISASMVEDFKVNEDGQQAEKDNTNLSSITHMLTEIETYLDGMFGRLRSLDPKILAHAVKIKEQRESERRRKELIIKNEKERQARIKKVLERATAPVKKRKGKPIMFRSRPSKKIKKVVKVEKDDNKNEIDVYADFWE
ncbi:hypothetical protein PCE1_002015 [Barthelona sp. PCE]